MIKYEILKGFSIYLLRVTLVSMSATPTTSGRSTWEVSEQTTISSLTKTLDTNVILLPWQWCILTQKEPKKQWKSAKKGRTKSYCEGLLHTIQNMWFPKRAAPGTFNQHVQFLWKRINPFNYSLCQYSEKY